MALLKGGRANVIISNTDKTFAAMGFTVSNMDIVYKMGESIQSWKPERSINAITAFEVNQGYYIVPKQDIDTGEDLVSSLQTLVLAGDGTYITYP